MARHDLAQEVGRMTRDPNGSTRRQRLAPNFGMSTSMAAP
jgi:hypothetical protein